MGGTNVFIEARFMSFKSKDLFCFRLCFAILSLIAETTLKFLYKIRIKLFGYLVLKAKNTSKIYSATYAQFHLNLLNEEIRYEKSHVQNSEKGT